MPSIALPVSLRGQLLSGSRFNPISLFSAGEQGIWLEPSDLTTMFQDRAGTTPVTTPGQTVGLRLDKSKNGVGTNGASRRNLLTRTEEFDNAAWIKAGLNAFGSGSVANTTATTDPVGGNTAEYIQENSASGDHTAYVAISLTAAPHTFTVYCKAAQRTWVYVRLAKATGQGAYFNLSTGTIGTVETGITAAITSVGNGWYRCSVTITTDTTAWYPNILIATGDNQGAYTGNGTSGIYIWGAQLELGSTASTYQKITADWASTMAGNHAVAPTDAARPTYGIEPWSGRRNLLEQTEEFNNAYWTKTSATIIPDSDGIADLLYPSTSGTLRGIERTIGGVSSTPYTTSIEAKAAGLNFLYLYGAQGNVVAYFNLSTGAIGTVGSGLTATITDVGSGYYRCSVTQTVTTRFVYAGGCDANGSTQATASGTNGILIRKAQLEASATATAYQRVGTAFDVTEAGVPTVHYVQYDGTDDSFSTSSIDFSATDKMSVFAGVRKLSDAAQGVLAELSATIVSNNGSFLLAAPDGATATFGFDSKGTTQVDAVASSLTAPITRLVTGLADIAGDTTTIRINGVQADQDTGDQGTGNYGNYPLFIGRRNNATLPFNGRDYGILVVGKAVTPTEITNTESYLAANTSGVSI